MTITITMDLTAENLKKLQHLIPDVKAESAETPVVKTKPKKQPGDSVIPGQVSMFDQPIEELNATPAEAPAKTDEVPFDTADPAPASVPEQPAITKTDVRAVALTIAKAGKQAELAATFAKFGGKKLSDFDSRPEIYPALMQELKAINA